MWYSPRRARHSTMKRSEILIDAATWVDLEDAMLNDRRKTLILLERLIFYDSTYVKYLE